MSMMLRQENAYLVAITVNHVTHIMDVIVVFLKVSSKVGRTLHNSHHIRISNSADVLLI